MPRGRPRRDTVPLKVHIPARTDAILRTLLMDPVTQKVPHGAYGGLVTNLLNEYISKRGQNAKA